MTPFWVASLFGAASRKGLVEPRDQDWSLWLDTEQARKIARDILEAAEATDHGHFMRDFFRDHAASTTTRARCSVNFGRGETRSERRGA